MRMSLRMKLPILIFMIMCLMILTPSAMAVENPSVHLDVTMRLSGTLPDTPEDFTIKLFADELSSPMPEGSLNGVFTMTITGAGSVTLPKIIYTRVGTHDYTIVQEAGNNPDCSYDETLYDLTVFVTNSEVGGLETTVVLHKTGEVKKPTSVVFNNNYAGPSLIKLQALKTLNDEVPKDDRFSFMLTDHSGQVLQTKTNKAGKVLFDEFSIKEVGSKTFYIKEKLGNETSVIYDTSEYKVIVVTTKDESGNYQSTISYEKSDKTFEGTPIFKNKTKEVPLPSTGEARSSMPLIGGVFLLGGMVLTFTRKKA